MSIAETNRVGIYISEETVWGETPSSPAMVAVPFSGGTLGHAKEVRNSVTIRNDAQRSKILEVGASAEGDLNFELIYSDYDTILEHLYRSTFTTNIVTDTSISFDSATQKVLDSGNGFGDFVVGQWVSIAGAYNSENNGLFRVTDAAAGYLTLANGASSIVDESAGESITVKGRYMRGGTTNKSLLIEKEWSDISKYMYYTGMVVGNMSLNVQALEIINGSFSFMGKRGIPIDSAIHGSTTDATGNSQMTASANVGTILVDNVALTTPIRRISLTVNNNLRARPQVGSKYSAEIGRGEFSVDGEIEAYFEDHTLLNDMVDHTAFALSWRCTDVDGNVMIFTVPECYFLSGNPDTPGQNDDVVLTMPIGANIKTGTNYNYTLQIDAISA